MITFDSETCGLHGMPVLLQYAIDDYPVELYDIWLNKVGETLKLIEMFANHKGGICGFNLAFDWFHICKTYTIFNLVKDKDKRAIDCLMEIAEKEMEGRDGPCVKPYTACDVMLHAKKGPYQSTMDRKPIIIKKVPIQLAKDVCRYLNQNLKINPIYFAHQKDPFNPWKVNEFKDKETGVVDDNFKNICLNFTPSASLKNLYADVFKIPFSEVIKFKDVELPKNLFPEEIGYAPWALAVENIKDAQGNRQWANSWPALIKLHIKHWASSDKARKYAEDDVVYTRKLYQYFGSPPMGDDDSILACAIAANRWKGFAVDLTKLKEIREESIKFREKVPTAGKAVKEYILDLLDEDEKILVHGSTNKVSLEQMETWVVDCECEGLNEECKICKGKGTYPHPVSSRAVKVRKARALDKEIETIDKIIKAGRLQASFKVIGALSGRMAGADDLNPQGIKSAAYFRVCFPLASNGFKLIGGDFESFEPTIAAAAYNDPQLENDLKQVGLCADCKGTGVSKKGDKCSPCNGSGKTKKKLAGLFGEVIYNMSYDDIILSKGSDEDYYKKSKQGSLSQMYMGTEHTLINRLGLSPESAAAGYSAWQRKYPLATKAQQTIINQFQTMVQVGNLGSKIKWNEPSEYVESLLGFRRYFTLENEVCRWLFKLAEDPPKEWTNLKLNVVRRDRVQTAAGAVRSAIFAAAFNIQSNNTRAAGNHRIQSTGAQICKNTQRKIWDHQPHGVHEWKLQVLNVHDEIMVPCKPEIVDDVTKTVKDNVESYRHIIPLIAIDWSTELETWADK